jgi:cell wall assembly regulator SMI1
MSLETSLSRIKSWMNAHGAGVLVENLAAGASAAQLAACEAELGFALPVQLSQLWSIHAGQLDEQNGFVGAMDLLGPATGPAEGESITMALELLREDRRSWAEAGVNEAEATSDAWVAFAGRGYADLLVVSALSGRVFSCTKDSPPLHLVAPSIEAWLSAYADRVEAGAYTVEEGFGNCYLARDDSMF